MVRFNKYFSRVFFLLQFTRKFWWAGFFILLLCTASCNTVDPPPDKAVLTLTLEDVSCTEAWITLTTNNLQLPATLNLIKDNTITKTINLQTADTLLYIDSLLPNQTYNFQAISQSSNQSIKSNEIAAATLDTTSHNFTWQTWTFGEHSSSTLYDVAIVNENCIWAVGEIYMNDSLGNPDYNAYNAVHWDGTKWELKRIQFYTFCPQATGEGSYPARSVFAFDSENVIVSSGSQIAYLKSGIQINKECVSVSVNKIWGTSLNDFYIVGYGGNIAHWNGSKWTKIESGTDVNLRDISGQGDDIFVSGYSLDYSKSVLLRLENNNVELIWENNSSGTPHYGSLVYASKVLNNNLFVASSNGVYQDKLKIKHPIKQLFFSFRTIYRITVTGVNDLFTAGDRATVWHYNGITSREVYSEPDIPSPFYSADAKDKIFAAVGTRVENVIHHKATILIGKR